MIRHIVFFSVRKSEDFKTVHDALWRLGDIPGVTRFEVGTNEKYDSLSREIDLIVYAEFADRAALEGFKSHPIYEATITVVRPRRALRLVADYDTARLKPIA